LVKQQEINQIYTPSEGKAKPIKRSMTTPNIKSGLGEYGKVPGKRL